MSIKAKHKANAKMLYLIEQYRRAHPEAGEEKIPGLIAPWAIANGLWHRDPIQPEEILRRDLSRALREEYIIDPQGREVRKNHAILVEYETRDGVKKRSSWFPIYEAPPNHMRTSISLRRRAALNDVRQLQLDFESYNENNIFHVELEQPDFNFNADLDDLRQADTYPEGPESDDETEDDI